MAEIEKGLPNTRTKIDVPSDEEIAQEVAVLLSDKYGRKIPNRSLEN